jgi:putative transcriptional regulator
MRINLGVEMAKYKIFRIEVAQRAGLSTTNLLLLKTGKAKVIRFSTPAVISKELDFQPGDVLEYVGEEGSEIQMTKGTEGFIFNPL